MKQKQKTFTKTWRNDKWYDESDIEEQICYWYFHWQVSQRLLILIKNSEIWKPQLNFDIFFHCIVFGQIFVNMFVDDTEYASGKTFFSTKK